MDQKTMRELEAKCIQESPPGCTTACPVHVDARALIAAVQNEDFGSGVKIFRKVVPFPRIISRVCDEPCQAQCKRKEAGDPIAVNALERACMEYGGDWEPKLLPVIKKDKKIAVVGGGLSGLTVALELAQKGYPVVIYEKEGALGGSIRALPAVKLPPELVEADLRAVQEHPLIEINLGIEVGAGGSLSLVELLRQFDAVYLGTGRGDVACFGPALDSEGRLSPDPLTLQTGHPQVFAGGTLALGVAGKSPIMSISHGKKAANSIARLLQNVSLTAERDKEGPYPTALYTNIAGIPPAKRVMPADPQQGFTREEALLEAKRCLQCECMECVKACAYLAHYGAYPKRYVREIYNNLSIVMGMRHANKMINSCSLCGMCREVCPNGLNMGEICRAARQLMVRTGKMPPSAHEFALRDFRFSTGDRFVLHRHQPGFTSSSVLFFPGCQLSASKPQYVQKLYELLCGKIPGGVGLSLGCCGAPAQWAGAEELFRETLANLEQEWRALGSPRVITGCPTCYSIFRQEMPAVEVETIWTVLDRLEVVGERAGTGRPLVLAVHDACTTRQDQELQDCVRRIATQLGHQVVELERSRLTTDCCGYGGLMSFANREVARQVRRRRVEEHEADYLVYCAMCRDNYAKEGKKVFHLLDLLFGDPALTGAEKGPGFSKRQENRAKLKQSLLQEMWGETVTGEQAGVKLIIPERVQELLEERMILEEDLQAVIAYAESTGNKFKHTENNTFIAYFRPVTVTYWVEYSPQGDGFLIHNAYSHRLQIEG